MYVADILKANEEVLKVLKLYEEVINKADVVSLLVDENAGRTLFSGLADSVIYHCIVTSVISRQGFCLYKSPVVSLHLCLGFCVLPIILTILQPIASTMLLP